MKAVANPKPERIITAWKTGWAKATVERPDKFLSEHVVDLPRLSEEFGKLLGVAWLQGEGLFTIPMLEVKSPL